MKKMAKSRTLWFSLALVIFGSLEASFPYLESVIDQKYYGIILVGVGVICAILRFYTTQPLDEK